MINVELIYDHDCPNIEDTRLQLRRAFSDAGLSNQWKEWDRASADSPIYVKKYGSPTILVNGLDVIGAQLSDNAACCRIYQDKGGRFTGVPPIEKIIAALRIAMNTSLTPIAA